MNPYVPLTEMEVRQLATDIYNNRVFGTWDMDMRHPLLLGMIFSGVNGLPEEEWVNEHDIHQFYEYIDKSTGSLANGYPVFFSVKALSREDMSRVSQEVETLEDMVRSLVN
jgi:hypothetical protein